MPLNLASLQNLPCLYVIENNKWGMGTHWQKANAVWQKELAAYERPPMDAAIEEELDAFVAKRVEQGGAPTDF